MRSRCGYITVCTQKLIAYLNRHEAQSVIEPQRKERSQKAECREDLPEEERNGLSCKGSLGGICRKKKGQRI